MAAGASGEPSRPLLPAIPLSLRRKYAVTWPARLNLADELLYAVLALEVSMRRSAAACSLSCLTAGLLAGCPDRSIDKVDPEQGRVEAKDIPVNVNRNLDLLFLIDNSPSMRDKQLNLANNFGRFIDVLSTIPGGLPSIHIGVVTSDLGTHGTTAAGPPQIGSIGDGGCKNSGNEGNLQRYDAPITDGKPYLEDLTDASGTRKPNYTGSLSAAFGKMAQGAGAGGCGFEQHLEAMKVALQPGHPANAGFVRNGDMTSGDPEAYLGVILIADEDDCSLADATLLSNGSLGALQSFRCTRYGVTCDDGGRDTTAMNQVGTKGRCHPNDNSQYLTKVADYATFLKNLKSDPKKVIVAGIMGTPEPFAVEFRTPPGTSTAVPALFHSCTYNGANGPEVADPPVRMQFFLDRFPNRNTSSSICQQDLSGGLQQVGDLLKTALGYPCIEGKLADADPSTAGMQYDCSVSVISAGNSTMDLPHCPSDLPDDAPCWHLVTEPISCPGGDHVSVAIEGQLKLPSNARAVASCAIERGN